ncbi:MAG: spermidine synthase SpeE [Bacteroidetes bacterium HLUCCA01]|nr:MAG: spermidine synthase SpeE [Bacteroidetes bacterium HLUCCA01]
MPFQYLEHYNGTTGLTVGVNKVLFSEQTPYQKVEVFETDTWGNLMTIDGMVMLSEKDEFVYHEMIAHVACFSHPNPKRVLIIGGGDGGTAREVLKHPSVEHVDMVEIDEAVVRASKLHMPGVGDFDNPKLHVLYENGLTFVDHVDQKYDVIIIDGSDPVGPAVDLFKQEFYDKCRDALTEDGVLTGQTESPWVHGYHESIQSVFRSVDNAFSHSRMYLAFIPLYPTGMWSMVYASKGIDPLSQEVKDRVAKGMQTFGQHLRYYNVEIHTAAFALPGFVKDIIS